jgi:serine/threonine protein phosphatase PrpC
VTTLRVQGPGWLLACSDGLWNYCSAPEDLAAVARRVGAGSGAEPLATASALVDWANEQGGHDNISVALARVDPAGGSVPEMKEQVGE